MLKKRPLNIWRMITAKEVISSKSPKIVKRTPKISAIFGNWLALSLPQLIYHKFITRSLNKKDFGIIWKTIWQFFFIFSVCFRRFVITKHILTIFILAKQSYGILIGKKTLIIDLSYWLYTQNKSSGSKEHQKISNSNQLN